MWWVHPPVAVVSLSWAGRGGGGLLLSGLLIGDGGRCSASLPRGLVLLLAGSSPPPGSISSVWLFTSCDPVAPPSPVHACRHSRALVRWLCPDCRVLVTASVVAWVPVVCSWRASRAAWMYVAAVVAPLARASSWGLWRLVACSSGGCCFLFLSPLPPLFLPPDLPPPLPLPRLFWTMQLSSSSASASAASCSCACRRVRGVPSG